MPRKSQTRANAVIDQFYKFTFPFKPLHMHVGEDIVI